MDSINLIRSPLIIRQYVSFALNNLINCQYYNLYVLP